MIKSKTIRSSSSSDLVNRMTRPLVTRIDSDVFHTKDAEESSLSEGVSQEDALDSTDGHETNDNVEGHIAPGVPESSMPPWLKAELADAEFIPLKTSNDKMFIETQSQEASNGVLHLSGGGLAVAAQDPNTTGNGDQEMASVDSYEMRNISEEFSRLAPGMPVPPLDLGSLRSTGSSIESIKEVTHHEVDFLRSKVCRLQEENDKLNIVVLDQKEKIQILESKVHELEEKQRTAETE